MRILSSKAVGLFIDVQEKLFPHMYEKDILEEKLKKLISGLKVLEVPTLITEQYVKGLGNTIDSVIQSFGDYNPIEKLSFSCCDDTEFMVALKATGRTQVIISGIEAHVCILQTVLDLLDLGFQPVVVSDCISSRKIEDKQIAIERMMAEGAIITTLESILFELTRKSRTPEFKAISSLIK